MSKIECLICVSEKCDSVSCDQCKKEICGDCYDSLRTNKCPYCRAPYTFNYTNDDVYIGFGNYEELFNIVDASLAFANDVLSRYEHEMMLRETEQPPIDYSFLVDLYFD